MKDTDISKFIFLSYSEKQTLKLGEKIANFLKAGDILCLFGPLGSGKTVFVKGIAKGLKIRPRIVNSPSFVLIREYEGKLPLYHIDLYRLKKVQDILKIGYQDYLYSEGITAIEWAERLDWLLPNNYFRIEFEIVERNIRKLKFIPLDNHYNDILKKLKI
ncbi:MAG: tRNA (adenosine(37)-N6)-threonylcarbamoyltransferase complex ATPase subunit type 1 TsaE [Candidatus Omnitrophica bacterium]|nr:tRNA (adenosine(37)-N6)-threonylcarbamoyltransferase complex ATPase subunit type 1 TsaE [Candidatus Omnitrophota bacterium]